MEDNEVYVYEENLPVEESQRNALRHQSRGDNSAAYLIELPEVSNARIAPETYSRPRARRESTIVNTTSTHTSPYSGSTEEPLETYIKRNLINFRKSISPEDLSQSQPRRRETITGGSIIVMPFQALELRNSRPLVEPSQPHVRHSNRESDSRGHGTYTEDKKHIRDYEGHDDPMRNDTKQMKNKQTRPNVYPGQSMNPNNVLTVMPALEPVSVSQDSPFNKAGPKKEPKSRVKVMLMVESSSSDLNEGGNASNGKVRDGNYPSSGSRGKAGRQDPTGNRNQDKNVSPVSTEESIWPKKDVIKWKDEPKSQGSDNKNHANNNKTSTPNYNKEGKGGNKRDLSSNSSSSYFESDSGEEMSKGVGKYPSNIKKKSDNRNNGEKTKDRKDARGNSDGSSSKRGQVPTSGAYPKGHHGIDDDSDIMNKNNGGKTKERIDDRRKSDDSTLKRGQEPTRDAYPKGEKGRDDDSDIMNKKKPYYTENGKTKGKNDAKKGGDGSSPKRGQGPTSDAHPKGQIGRDDDSNIKNNKKPSSRDREDPSKKGRDYDNKNQPYSKGYNPNKPTSAPNKDRAKGPDAKRDSDNPYPNQNNPYVSKNPTPVYRNEKPQKYLLLNAPKSASKMVSRRRYHIQIPEHGRAETWFTARFNMNDENDVDMKYEGPVKITQYYSSNNYT